MRKYRAVGTASLALALVGAACSSSPEATTTTVPTTTAASTATTASGETSAEVNAFISSVTDWDRLAPPAESLGTTSVSEATRSEVEEDGVAYVCEAQTYSLTESPREVVLADPNAGQIWPGAVLDGSAHVLGSLRPIAIDGSNRAPLGMSVAGGGVLGIRGGVSTVVEEPVGSTVREGINQLIANALDSDVAPGAGFSSFKSVESHSAEQAVLELGLSARYLGNSVDAELSYDRAASQHTYTAYFIQRLYTIAVDPPQAPADFFADEITPENLENLGIGLDSPPLYIGSVSYGRILTYSITSSESRQTIEGAIEYSYNAVVGGVDASVEAGYQQTLQNAQIEVLAVGGPNTGVQGLIRDANLASYFEADLALNQVEPIAFTVNRLSDNQVAEVVDSTEYEVRTCEIVAGGLPQPDFWWPFDGSLEDVVFGADLKGVTEEYVAGQFGQAFPFRPITGSANTFGTVDGVDVSQVVPTDRGFSISAWINPRTTALGTIISQVGMEHLAGDFALRAGLGSTPGMTDLYFYRRPNSGNATVDNQFAVAALTLNEWNHVVAVYGSAEQDATSMRSYVNGEPVVEEVIPSVYTGLRGEAFTRVGTSELGPDAVGSTQHMFPFDGSIDELMVFTRPLTRAEVALMYQNFADYKR